MCVYTPDTVDINIEAENLGALSSVFHLDYNSPVDNSNLQSRVVDDGASDDRAEKCYISCDYYYRKRYLALNSTAADKQCKYVHSYVVNK